MGAELITFTWKGRQLHSIYDEYNNATLTYTYNDDGIRTKKHWQFEDDSTETIEYILDDNNTLVKQVYTYQYPDDEPEVETIYYFYDETGFPAYLSYNDINLYYVKNLQGDVMGIMTSDGTTVISYGYDAWGNVIEEELYNSAYYWVANLQAYRYRSYIYDNDTGYYYLQSRYYDPTVGRFLNADDTNYLGYSETVLAYNLYAYCENNAVCCIDTTGEYNSKAYRRELDAVYAFADLYNGISIRKDYEYATFIFRVDVKVRNKNSFHFQIISFYYYFSPWTDGDSHSIDFTRIDRYRNRYNIVATVHTHSAYSKKYDGENFSKADIVNANRRKLNSYLITPGGAIKYYNYSIGRIWKMRRVTYHDRWYFVGVNGRHPKCPLCAN